MGSLFNTVRKFFEDEKWIFVDFDSDSILQMTYQGTSGQWSCYAQVGEEDQIVRFYSICPVIVPETHLAAAAEYLMRANFGLKIGNFEMDYSDGEVRYKTSLDVENAMVSRELISNMVNANLATTNRYLGGLFEVINGNIPPAEAIQKAEGS